MTKIKSESVSSLVNLLMGKPFNFVDSRYLSEGRWCHNRLGYNNMQMLQRQMYGYRVRGMPDLIEDDLIIELKTYRSPKTKKYQEEKGAIQANIYCLLGSYSKYRVDIFDVKSDKLSIGKPIEADEKKARTNIKNALNFKHKLEKLVNERPEILK